MNRPRVGDAQRNWHLVASPAEPVVIGHIARPYGVRGEMKVVIESGDIDRLNKLDELVIRTQGNYYSFEVISIIPRGNWLRVKVKGIDSPEDAARLSGGEIVTSTSGRPQLKQAEYYVDDIIGCRVVSDAGEELGFVTEVWHQAHHDIWVIMGDMGEILVPSRSEFVERVDLENHLITVKRIDGLWG